MAQTIKSEKSPSLAWHEQNQSSEPGSCMQHTKPQDLRCYCRICELHLHVLWSSLTSLWVWCNFGVLMSQCHSSAGYAHDSSQSWWALISTAVFAVAATSLHFGRVPICQSLLAFCKLRWLCVGFRFSSEAIPDQKHLLAPAALGCLCLD